jgi:hypothetical protein
MILEFRLEVALSMGTINRNANLSRSAHVRHLNVRAAPASLLPASAMRGPAVTLQQRRRLAECCAFFKAEKYRRAGPGKIRASDVKRALAEIDAAIEECGKRDESGERICRQH